jgi:hypothetical protein
VIVVRVELHSAVTGKVTPLYTGIVANDGTGTAEVGNYDAAFGRKGQTDLRRVWASARRRSCVKGHRRRSSHVLNLVAQALNRMGFK